MNKSLILFGATGFLLFGGLFMSMPSNDVENQTNSSIRTGVYASDGTELDHIPWKDLPNVFHSPGKSAEQTLAPRLDVYLPDGSKAEKIPWEN